MAEHHTQDAELLDRLEKLARDATPGEWHVTKYCSVMDEGMETLVVSSDSSHEDRAFIAAANPAALLKLIAMARRSIPQGDEPAKAAAQGDELPPLPILPTSLLKTIGDYGRSYALGDVDRLALWNDLISGIKDYSRDYGAACRAGRAKGEDVVSHLKAAREAIQRVSADLGVLHEDKPPEMAATIALTGALVSGDLELAANYISEAIDAARNQTGGKE